MPEFKISWGIKGDHFDEEIIEVATEDHAWQEAKNRAMDLVSYSVDRISPLSKFEIDMLRSKAFGAFLELPEEERSDFLKALIEQAKTKG